MERFININGVDYKIVALSPSDPFERMSLLKPKEAARYYGFYMYRTEQGEPRMCDALNPDNNFSV